MSITIIEQDKGNTRSKLTITKQEVRLKYAYNIDVNLRKRLLTFAEDVASRVQPLVTYTLRGEIDYYKDKFSVLLKVGKSRSIKIMKCIENNPDVLFYPDYDQYKNNV